MNKNIVISTELPDAWRCDVHGVIMSKEEYELSCDIDDSFARSEESATLHAVAIGVKLMRFKELLGHNRFGHWRRKRFDGSIKTTQRYMLIAKHFGECAKSICHLPLSLTHNLLIQNVWQLLGDDILEDINDGKALDADEIRAKIAVIERNRPKKTTKKPIIIEHEAHDIITERSDHELRVIDQIATFLKQCDDNTISVILTMESLRIGEMLRDNLLTARSSNTLT